MNYECYCALCSGPLVTSSLRGTEEYTYNQDLIKQETTRWIADVRCLGLNFNSTDHDKYIITPCLLARRVNLLSPGHFSVGPASG